jgi:hypothetical protein
MGAQIPHVNIAYRCRGENIDDGRVGHTDITCASIEVGGGNIAGSVAAEGYASDGEEGAARYNHRAMVVVNGCPEMVAGNMNRGNPGGAPYGVVGPDPAIGGCVPPAAIVACEVTEGIFIHPDVTTGRYIVPVSITVGHIINDGRGSPVSLIVHLYPVAIAGKIIGSHTGSRFRIDLSGNGL